MFQGIRVLDLTGEPGWLAGKILGDCGADVVKVEPPGGDPGRVGPWLGDTPHPDRSLAWLALNTSKRGITLDLCAEGGRDLLQRLAARADVLLESFRPGWLAERGISGESLRARNPRLVHCAVTPFGQTGPRAGWRAHDLVSVAMGGNAAMTGDADRPPVRCSMPTAYYHAGAEAALGVAMALYAREDTGRGQLVDVSMQECQLPTLVTGPGMHAHDPQPRKRSGAVLGRTREIWRAKDGWISFGLRGGAARIPNLVATVGYMAEEGMAPPWLRELDWRSYDPHALSDAELARLEEAFGVFFAAKTRRELYAQALARRILLAPCNDAAEIAAQEQLRDRGFFTTLEYPQLGAAVEHPGFFALASRSRIGIRRPAPRVGEHDAEVYAELGIDADALSVLAADGVV